MSAQITVLVVDDQVLFRQGLVALLRSQSDFVVVGEAGSATEAVEQARRLQPALMLMDYGLPDGTGVDATRQILAEQPDAKIVILTVHDEPDLLFVSVRAGAKGYLLKNTRVEKLLAYLRGLQQDEPAIEPHMTARILEEFSRSRPVLARDHALKELSAREREVLDLMAAGASNTEIANRLVISEHTVKNHVRHILAKLELPNRREAAKYVSNRAND